ncbi:TRAP transporter small permease [Rubrimonas sp.]|uniref:TRAP transporter small permease n=1 Tax=Rubrimonas sp. TaxID=2036015 RepID=UPI002FDECB43
MAPVFARALRRALDALYLLGGAVAALCLIAILCLIVAQMLARWFGVVFPGATDYAGYAMAGASFFGFAYALNHGAHIRVSLVLNLMGARRYWLELACFAIGAVISSYLAWYAVRAVRWSLRFGDVSQGLDRTPLWIPQSAMAAGAILLALAFWDHLARLVFAGAHGMRGESLDRARSE